MKDDVRNIEKLLEFNVNRELRYAIHRDWGLYYKKLKLLSPAINNFQKSHLLNKTKLKPILEKSKCNLEISLIDPLAIDDAKICKQYYGHQLNVKEHYNECYFQLNEFEKSLKESYNTMAAHPNGRNCKKNVELIHSTLQNAIGIDAGPCLYKFRRIINRLQIQDEQNIIDNRPFWKILRDNNRCDVIDEREKNQKNITPLEEKRKIQNTIVGHNIYLDLKTAKDIMFLKEIPKNKSVHLAQTPFSNYRINDIVNGYHTRIVNCEQMLWKRQPIFSKQYSLQRLSNSKMQSFKENSLYHMQAETRRTIFKQLVAIKKLRLLESDEPRQMINYAEKILAEYYSIKTNRICLRKFEFINEICNIIGLSYLDKLKIPSVLMEIPITKRMPLLLNMPLEELKTSANNNISNKSIRKKSKNKEKSFDIRNTFVDPDAPDWNYLKYKNRIDYYEKRSLNSNYPIEKCYLYHEAANLHLQQRKLDATKQMGKKIIEQAYLCGNYVWIFLGYIMIIRFEHASNNLNAVAYQLERIQNIAKHLNESSLHYIQIAKIVNEDELIVELKNEEQRK